MIPNLCLHFNAIFREFCSCYLLTFCSSTYLMQYYVTFCSIFKTFMFCREINKQSYNGKFFFLRELKEFHLLMEMVLFCEFYKLHFQYDTLFNAF